MISGSENRVKSRDCRTYGTWAEMLVIAELIKRGFQVAVPVIDNGVDLVVDYSLCVQVKSFTHGSHHIPMRRAGTRGAPLARRVDVVICVNRDGGAWLIIPSVEIGAVGNIRVSAYRCWLDRWDVLGLPADDVPVYEADTQAALFDV